MSGLAEKLYYVALPPTKAADDPEHQVQSAVTGAAAASFDWAGSLGANAPKGKCWVTVEALTTPVYVRFGPTSTTATTTSNGIGIPAGTKESFYVNPIEHRYIDHISSGAGVIKVQVSSPIGERLYV